ncbi:MAG TPA: hypothetical protein VEJ18_13370 [Planctomycetota bacterium]|nr:hypothetical protein [Planctomycetota bacterium]
MRTMTAILAVLVAGSATAQDSARDEAVRRLSALKATVDFDGQRLVEAMDFIRDLTGLNVVVAPSAALKEGDATVRLRAKDLPVRSILKLLLHNRGLRATWRDGAVVVVPEEELRDSVVLRVYDVRSLTAKLQDHPGPKVELATGKTHVDVVFHLEEPRPLMEGDFLVDLVRANTGGRSWDGDSAEIRMADGRLIVSQTPAVHAEIEQFLRKVGRAW